MVARARWHCYKTRGKRQQWDTRHTRDKINLHRKRPLVLINRPAATRNARSLYIQTYHKNVHVCVCISGDDDEEIASQEREREKDVSPLLSSSFRVSARTTNRFFRLSPPTPAYPTSRHCPPPPTLFFLLPFHLTSIVSGKKDKRRPSQSSSALARVRI